MPDLTILMPVYNEEERVREAIEHALGVEYPFTVELLIVDDGSVDGTPAILSLYADRDDVRVVRLPANRGKGAALRAGVQEARGRYTGILDADLEYQARDLVGLMQPLLEEKANA